MSVIREVYSAKSGDKEQYSLCCQIPLTRGFVALVDPEDFERFARFKWSSLVTKTKVYAHRKQRGADGKYKVVYLHRAVVGAGEDILVDHEDGDGLNCRRSNLRQATYSQNRWNSRPVANLRTGFLGVRCEANGGFRGRVISAGKYFHTETVSTPEEAAHLRDALAIRLHGDFAVLNFNAVNAA